jgi:azurin
MITRLLTRSAVLAAALVVGLPGAASTQAAKPAEKPAPAAGQAAKPAAGQAAKPAAGKARTIELQGTDSLKFVPATIQAKPGETIRVVLKTVSTMPKMVMSHNFVLLTPAANVETFVNESMKARTTDYIAPARKGDILAATKMAGGGETVEVTFQAPEKPGSYTFVCTFPGHFAGGMKGVLIVK